MVKGHDWKARKASAGAKTETYSECSVCGLPRTRFNKSSKCIGVKERMAVREYWKDDYGGDDEEVRAVLRYL